MMKHGKTDGVEDMKKLVVMKHGETVDRTLNWCAPSTGVHFQIPHAVRDS